VLAENDLNGTRTALDRGPLTPGQMRFISPSFNSGRSDASNATPMTDRQNKTARNDQLTPLVGTQEQENQQEHYEGTPQHERRISIPEGAYVTPEQRRLSAQDGIPRYTQSVNGRRRTTVDLTNLPELASPQRPPPRKVSVQVPVADATAESGYATGAGASTVNVGAGAAGGGTPSTLWTTKEVLHRGAITVRKLNLNATAQASAEGRPVQGFIQRGVQLQQAQLRDLL